MSYSKKLGGIKHGISEKWRKFNDMIEETDRHQEAMKAELVRVGQKPPQELAKLLGISEEGARQLADHINFYVKRGL